MLTPGELQVVGSEEAREAIENVLAKSMLNNGRLDLGGMVPTQIDYAIHLLRQYRVLIGVRD